MSMAGPTLSPEQIAVVNAGSSSIKFALFAAHEQLMFKGQVEKIGVGPRLRVNNAGGGLLVDRQWSADEVDHHRATQIILDTVSDLTGGQPVSGVGHRVVHGGMRFSEPTLVTDEVVAELRTLVPLAPLHQPHNLAPIEAIRVAAPAVPQVACFDTAFHRGQPELAQMFALPRELTEAGIRRYGFHGLSYEFVSGKLNALDPALAKGRLIAAHLGNGASLCAMHDGRSVATTMGFTAVDGLMMGTRCGSLDAGVLIYLMDQKGWDARQLEDLLYRKSGLLGVSGVSSDMRALRESDAPDARLAVDLFVYRIVREIGSLAAALGGLDGLVFTGGIGEHDQVTRSKVVDGCQWLGAKLDAAANECSQGRIDLPSSAIRIWVVPTDEERIIARHTATLVREPAEQAAE